MTTATLDKLAARLGASFDSHGRAHATCPSCGAEPETRTGARAYHFYLYDLASGAAGAKCWVCGGEWSIAALAQELDMDVSTTSYIPRERVEIPPAGWRASNAIDNYRAFQSRQWDHVVANWQAYKPLDELSIASADLGVGRLPLWHQDKGWYAYRFDRLIVPLIDADDRIVGIRARAMDARDRGPKWITGSTSDRLFCGLDDVCAGDVVVWCENLVDRLLAKQRSDQRERRVFVSTGGVSWSQQMLDELVARRPKHVVVWFDNDLAGAPNKSTFFTLRDEWRRKMQERVDRGELPRMPAMPRPRAWTLVDQLRERGVSSSWHLWTDDTPHHADLGWLLDQEQTAI